MAPGGQVKNPQVSKGKKLKQKQKQLLKLRTSLLVLLQQFYLINKITSQETNVESVGHEFIRQCTFAGTSLKFTTIDHADILINWLSTRRRS